MENYTRVTSPQGRRIFMLSYLNIVRLYGELYAFGFSTTLSLRSKNIMELHYNIIRLYGELFACHFGARLKNIYILKNIMVSFYFINYFSQTPSAHNPTLASLASFSACLNSS